MYTIILIRSHITCWRAASFQRWNAAYTCRPVWLSAILCLSCTL